METNSDRIVPFMAVPPIETVKDEMKARGMSQRELASRLGVKPSNLNRMFHYKTAITVPFAEKLEAAFGIPADFWLRMQSSYEKDLAAIEKRDEAEQKAITIERMLCSEFNMVELYKGLKIKPTIYAQEKLARLRALTGIDPLLLPSHQIAYTGVRYKKSDALHSNEKNMLTWNVLAYVASKGDAPNNEYEAGDAIKAAAGIVRLAHKGEVTENGIKDILSKCGVSYSVVPNLPQAPIDACSFWSNEYPSIVTTHRHKGLYRLVFSVLHELGHIELHLRKLTNTVYVAEQQTDVVNDKKEREANEFAENAIISPQRWKGVMASGTFGIGASDIVSYLKDVARKEQLNFELLLWRYKFETKRYAFRGVRETKIV